MRYGKKGPKIGYFQFGLKLKIQFGIITKTLHKNHIFQSGQNNLPQVKNSIWQ